MNGLCTCPCYTCFAGVAPADGEIAGAAHTVVAFAAAAELQLLLSPAVAVDAVAMKLPSPLSRVPVHARLHSSGMGTECAVATCKLLKHYRGPKNTTQTPCYCSKVEEARSVLVSSSGSLMQPAIVHACKASFISLLRYMCSRC